MTNIYRISASFLASAMLLLAAAPVKAAELLDVRFGLNGDATRIVFDINGPAHFSISGDETGQGRLLIDFTDLSLTQADRNFRTGKGHVARYGFAVTSGSKVRAVLEFSKTAKIKEAFMIPPSAGVKKHRLVIDLTTAPKQAFLASLPNRYPDLAAVIEQATSTPDIRALPAPPSPTQKEVAAPSPMKRKVVVIDAGHGGADPGAQGQSGTYEKTVTLAAALQLAETLKKRGRYEVILTRKSDNKIRPDKREARAREAGADLFISLHADAISQKAVRGASVYTLSHKGSVRSAALAKSQGDYQEVYNLDLEEFDQVVGGMLFDKAQDSTSTASSSFAEVLITNLTGKTPMLNRSHRTENLRVLLAPDVPAVLLEMAYISNSRDEANLNSPAWRKRTMAAVADSIDQYFNEQSQQRQAANRAGGAK